MPTQKIKATISIEGLKIKAYHGLLAQEKKVGNIFEVSLALNYPPAVRAFDSDNIIDTINYAEVVEIVTKQMAKPSELIEHVAGRIYRTLINTYPAITSGWIKISKIAPPMSAELSSVGVTINF